MPLTKEQNVELIKRMQERGLSRDEMRKVLERANEDKPQPQTASQPALQPQEEQKPGFIKQVAGDIIKPFQKAGLSALRIGQAVGGIAKGDLKSANEALRKGATVPFSGEKIYPVGSQPGIKEATKDIIGTGLDLGASLIGTGGVGEVVRGGAKAGAKEVTKQFVKTGAKLGALSGAATGAGVALQDQKGFKEVAKETAMGTAVGGVLGAISGKLEAKKFLKKPEKVAKLREDAALYYKKGLGATKEKQKENVNKLIPEIADRNWWGTRKGLLKKAEKGIELSGKQYEQLGELQGVVEIDGIVGKIDDQLRSYLRPDGTVKSFKKAQYNTLLEAKDDIMSYAVYDISTQNPVIYQEDLRRISGEIGKELYDTRKSIKTVSDSKTLSQLKLVDSSIRDVLSSNNPEYAKINKLFTASRRLKEVLEETLERKAPHNWLNLTDSIAGGTGAIIGASTGGGLTPAVFGAGLMAGLTHIAHSSWFNTLNAVRKAKIADRLIEKSPQEMMKWVIRMSNVGVKAANELIGE